MPAHRPCAGIPVTPGNRRCNVCLAPKPLDHFGVDRRDRDGRARTCLVCRRARDLMRYHTAADSERRRRWYEEGGGRELKQSWSEAHSDQRRKYNREHGKTPRSRLLWSLSRFRRELVRATTDERRRYVRERIREREDQFIRLFGAMPSRPERGPKHA